MISQAIDTLERIKKDGRIDAVEFKTLKYALYANTYGAWEFTQNSLPPIEQYVLLANESGDYLIAELCIVKMASSWVLKWQYYDAEDQSFVSVPLESYPYWTYLPRIPITAKERLKGRQASANTDCRIHEDSILSQIKQGKGLPPLEKSNCSKQRDE